MLRIVGPCQLHGSVKIQGAKNAAMRFPSLCFISPAQYTIKNVPDITSVKNLLEIAILEGAKVTWLNKNSFQIDTTRASGDKIIDADTFYHTSGGIYYLPVLASRFGRVVIKKHLTRTDTGGDAIGTRSLDIVRATFEKLGISSSETETEYEFRLSSTKPFEIDVANLSFSVSVNSIVAAMFKTGTSIVHKRSHEAEFGDVLRFLKLTGANIKVDEDDIYITGPCGIKGAEFTTLSDKNDFATWALAATVTRSKIDLTNVQPELMNIDPLISLLSGWKVKVTLGKDIVTIDSTSANLTPVDVIAGQYPLFHTDWQPLLAPVLTQVNGTSTLIDAVYDNRLQHFLELGKMGARYEFYNSPEYPSKSGTPRAVRVTGPARLTGTVVEAKDVRAGASLAIAALIAEGETTITHTEHIDRGYENFSERLNALGVECITRDVSY